LFSEKVTLKTRKKALKIILRENKIILVFSKNPLYFLYFFGKTRLNILGHFAY